MLRAVLMKMVYICCMGNMCWANNTWWSMAQVLATVPRVASVAALRHHPPTPQTSTSAQLGTILLTLLQPSVRSPTTPHAAASASHLPTTHIACRRHNPTRTHMHQHTLRYTEARTCLCSPPGALRRTSKAGQRGGARLAGAVKARTRPTRCRRPSRSSAGHLISAAQCDERFLLQK